jgi:hypothetical protein
MSPQSKGVSDVDHRYERELRRPRPRRVVGIEWEADRLDFRARSPGASDDCAGDNRLGRAVLVAAAAKIDTTTNLCWRSRPR